MPPRRAFQQSIQLFGTTWELGDGSKDRAKSTANLYGHACVVQLNCPDSGWRRFGSYATWDACRAATQVLRGTRRHLFEVISHDKPCKPYLDIDSETLPAPYQDVQQLVDHLQALVTRVFNEDYLIDLQPDAFQWLHSPNPKKMSLHLVISTHSPQLVFRSNHFSDPQGAAHLARRLAELDPECAGKIVDQAVYTRDREMRVCGASKFGKDSVLQPLRALTLEEMIDEPPLAPDTSLITAMDALTAVICVPELVPSIVRKANRLARTPRDIMQDGDVAEDSPFAISRMLELLQTHIHPTAYRERPAASEDPEKLVRFNFTNRAEPCYTGVVHGPTINLACSLDPGGDIYARCFSPLCAHAPRHRLGRLHAEPELFRAHAVSIDTPFLSPKEGETDDSVVSQDASLDAILRAWIDHPDRQGSTKAVSIRSPMGSGKSTLLDRVLTRLRETAARAAGLGAAVDRSTVLVLTYRQTLAYEQQRKLQNHGFTNYLDVPRDAAFHNRDKYPRVICQIESLRRVVGTCGIAELLSKFDLVIIDEVESVLRHFCSPTIGSPYSTLELLIEIIQGASRVIAMDAFLGDATRDFFQRIGVSNQVVINLHKGPPRIFEFSNHEAAWRARILEDVSNNLNVVVASLSTQMIYKMKQCLLRSEKVEEGDLLVHTSKSGDDIKKQLVDVDGLWTKYRVVLYSPTISAGVDFSADHFDRMYLYVCPLSCAPLGTLQMTGRVRKLRDRTVVCCTSPNMRLTGAPSRRAVTYAETMKFLRWMDKRIQEKQLLRVQLARVRVASSQMVDGGGDGEAISGTVTLPEESPLLALQARDRCERENAASRFFYDFQDMVVEAGHSVEVRDTSQTTLSLQEQVELEAAQEAAGEGEPDGMTMVVEKMLKGADVPALDGEYARELEHRVLANEATEEDKWSHFATSYKRGWGLDKLDESFIRKHGVRATSPRVALLIRVLYPPLRTDVSLESAVTARVSILRTPLILETLTALGVKSPFDTEHVIPDMMAVWEAGLKDVDFFKSYKQSARLFDLTARTTEWNLRTIVKALGVILGSVGLKLHSTRKQAKIDGKMTATFSYRLDGDHCAEMLELVKLKMRGSDFRAATPNAHARELLERDEFILYGHLVDLERPGKSAWAFIDV